MSDRKYRQRGYQDDRRDREPRQPSSPHPPGAPAGKGDRPEGPRTPHLMAAHEVCRCSRCGNRLALPIALEDRCPRCGAELHSCVQCRSFDPGARFECLEPIAARVRSKDGRNTCGLFAPRTTVERETGTPGPTSARQAFDDLFK